MHQIERTHQQVKCLLVMAARLAAGIVSWALLDAGTDALMLTDS